MDVQIEPAVVIKPPPVPMYPYLAALKPECNAEGLGPFHFTAADDKDAIYRARNCYGWWHLDTVYGLDEDGQPTTLIFDSGQDT